MEEVKQFESHCTKCVFALYVDDFSGPHKIQKGCQLGRIKKFEEQGRTRIEDNCYIVEGICNTNRGDQWANSNNNSELIRKVKKETEINVDVVILSLKGDQKNLEQKLEKTVFACVKQNDIKPRHIILAVQNKDVKFKKLYNNISTSLQCYDVKFQLMQIADMDTDISKCVDQTITKCQSQYTAVFDYNFDIEPNFISKFNYLINEELKRIVLVDPKNLYSGMIVQTKLFRLMGKNIDEPIFTKIKDICKDKKTDLIIDWDELCNQK